MVFKSMRMPVIVISNAGKKVFTEVFSALSLLGALWVRLI